MKKERSVGWSYSSNAGIVFGSVLSVLTGHSDKASTVQTILRDYAAKRSIYSYNFSTESGTETDFHTEILD